MLGVLAIFFAWYGLSWAYETLYREPRTRLGGEITKLKAEIETGKGNLTRWNQECTQFIGFYYRSLPRQPNDARWLYSAWLLELLKYCGVEAPDVNSGNPTRAAYGVNYNFNVRGTCSLDQFSRLLFEFYFASYLHRITAMSLAPVDGKEGQVRFAMTVNALGLRPRQAQDPYPMLNQLPRYYPSIRRLHFDKLDAYHLIADRNLMQAAKGGVDRADYTYLTAINVIDEVPEIWLTVRTDDSVTKARKGDSVRIGSFRAQVVEIIGQEDVVFERNGMRWLVALGDCLNEAYALPPEGFWNDPVPATTP